MKILLAATVPLFGFFACHSSGPKPPTPIDIDGGIASCFDMCANLAKLQCEEGTNPKCVDVCDKAAKLVILPSGCLANAKTKAEAQNCGSVKCP